MSELDTQIASLIDEYGKEKALEALKRGLEPWMVDSKTPWHPLRLAFDDAVNQAMYGKGERHGGATKMFYDQQWTTLADCHGLGFLTGQAAKKLNEAAQKDDDEAWEREVLGAIVYAGMAILKKRGYPE